MNDDNEFEKMMEDLEFDPDQIAADVEDDAIDGLRETIEKNVGTYLDVMIESAARRRALMLGLGFPQEDVSTMFEHYMRCAFHFMIPRGR